MADKGYHSREGLKASTAAFGRRRIIKKSEGRKNLQFIGRRAVAPELGHSSDRQTGPRSLLPVLRSAPSHSARSSAKSAFSAAILVTRLVTNSWSSHHNRNQAKDVLSAMTTDRPAATVAALAIAPTILSHLVRQRIFLYLGVLIVLLAFGSPSGGLIE